MGKFFTATEAIRRAIQNSYGGQNCYYRHHKVTGPNATEAASLPSRAQIANQLS